MTEITIKMTEKDSGKQENQVEISHNRDNENQETIQQVDFSMSENNENTHLNNHFNRWIFGRGREE